MHPIQTRTNKEHIHDGGSQAEEDKVARNVESETSKDEPETVRSDTDDDLHDENENSCEEEAKPAVDSEVGSKAVSSVDKRTCSKIVYSKGNMKAHV